MGPAVSSLVFQPPRSDPAALAAADAALTVGPLPRPEVVWLKTRRGRTVHSYYLNREASLTVLFSHANAEDLAMIYPWLREMSKELQVNVLAYDYTGYGRSAPGVPPSEADCFADIEAALAHLTEVRGVPADRVVLFGRSVGSGPTCHLAEKMSKEGRPVAGVVLQSPLASIFRVVFRLRFTLPGDLFVNRDRVPNIASPVFVVHGTHDELVPFWHGQEIFLRTRPRFRARPFWVEGACHNNLEALLRADGAFFERFRQFLDDDAWPFSQQLVAREKMRRLADLNDRAAAQSQSAGAAAAAAGGVGAGGRRAR